MILAIALSHPSLLERRCEELAAAEFAGPGLGTFRDALLAAPAEALQTSAALAGWLNGAGEGRNASASLARHRGCRIGGACGPRPSRRRRPGAEQQSLALHRRAGALHRDRSSPSGRWRRSPTSLILPDCLISKAPDRKHRKSGSRTDCIRDIAAGLHCRATSDLALTSLIIRHNLARALDPFWPGGRILRRFRERSGIIPRKLARLRAGGRGGIRRRRCS